MGENKRTGGVEATSLSVYHRRMTLREPAWEDAVKLEPQEHEAANLDTFRFWLFALL